MVTEFEAAFEYGYAIETEKSSQFYSSVIVMHLIWIDGLQTENSKN